MISSFSYHEFWYLYSDLMFECVCIVYMCLSSDSVCYCDCEYLKFCYYSYFFLNVGSIISCFFYVCSRFVPLLSDIFASFSTASNFFLLTDYQLSFPSRRCEHWELENGIGTVHRTAMWEKQIYWSGVVPKRYIS